MTASSADTSHEPQKLKLLILGAIGVVFGDIGTSPLYAFKESFIGGYFKADHTHIFSVLSLIFWSVTITVTIKYIMLMMRADNKGEGGSLSLFALASRFSHNAKWAPIIPVLGIFAAALFYGDSMITPAISVLSAIEGVNVVAPNLSHFIIPLTLFILAFLFALQRFGTASVGKLFGPIMCIWFLTISALGLANIFENPDVLQAVNPYYAVKFFIDDKFFAFLTLGSVVLAMTGGEALYADMGHFGRTPIRMGWTTLVFPALMLNYFGQGAHIMSAPADITNPFFLMAPDWMEWPLLILATLATIIASQAVITGAFSVTRQAIQLGYLPRMSIIHTDDGHIGQIYIPFINWMLMFCVVLLVLSFQTSSNLAHAYGVAVTGTMLIDTILLSVVIFKMWQWNKYLASFVLGALLIIDSAFFLATATKIPHGGWFPLVFGAAIFFILMTWKRGRALVMDKIRKQTMPVDVFFRDYCDNFPRVDGTAIYMSNLSDGIPMPLLMNIKHNRILHERNIFLHVHVAEKAYIREEHRFKIVMLADDFYRIVINYGYMDQIDVPRSLMSDDVQQIVHFKPDEVSYFIGRETVIPTGIPGMAIWREHVFAWLSRNSGSIVDFYKLPSKRVMELGSRIDI